MFKKRIEEEEAKETQAKKDHIDAMKVLKLDNESKSFKLLKFLLK
jgi:hypothetical protein